MGLSSIWTWSTVCQFQWKDFIPLVSCVWSWNKLEFHLLNGFCVMWYINNKHVPYLRKTIKNQNMHRRQKNTNPLRNNINWDSIYRFCEAKRNPEVVSGFKNCLLLFGNRIKQKRIYHCEKINSLVLIL